MKHIFVVIIFLMTVFSMATVSAEKVQKWVDENGKIHFGDVVPEKYKAKAEAVEVKQQNLMMPAKIDEKPPTTKIPETPGKDVPP